ncbi:MAG: sugar ABC transporter ATP-binding protein [Verrucomicrobiales bacterium]|nr:sugar ABC transporter ATP-binding protein [Verrucomicrobiales bacterium]
MPLLEARQLTKRFPGVVALNGVSFDLHPGEVHALCGENGAGKSTLIKTLSGIHPLGSYEGEIRVDDRPVSFRSLQDAEAAGIAVIYQELALVEEMSVAENIFLGHEPRRGPWVDWDEVRVRAVRLLEQFRIQLDPDIPVRELGVGQKQLVEIVKALAKKSRILILDEPTAALAETEVAILLGILRELRSAGVGCIYISHKLGEVMSLADRITVLRDGASITTVKASEADIPGIIRHMVGREIKDLFPRDRPASVGPVLLSVRNLDAAPDSESSARLTGIGFDVRAGEVLGIGGLMGAGRSETLMHLFGAWGTRLSGEVELGGRRYDLPAPGESIRRGLVMVTDDRKRYGLHLEQPIGYNLSLSSLDQVTRNGLLDEAAETLLDQGFFDALRIKAPGLDAVVGGLSGGNQQKVVIGKALMTDPRVVFLDEPTRGIDVAAKLEVYQLINRLTAEGRAVVLVSSELPELMGMSDRIVMLHEGTVGGTFLPAEYDPERLMAAAMGRTPVAED